MTSILLKRNKLLLAFCRVLLSCAVKPFCHLLIMTERSRGTEAKKTSKKTKQKRVEIDMKITEEMRGEKEGIK